MEYVEIAGSVFAVPLLLLLLGDFVATFIYHVPEHVFGRYHSLVHHSPNRSFVSYAVRKHCPQALLPGFLGAFPYLMWVPFLWLLSPVGTMLGLLLAELHVIWRHQEAPSYSTPKSIKTLCRWCCITTPERHQLHHRNANLAYGDVFTFYGEPAQLWLNFLRQVKRQLA
ncbi:sterol desaturase family protein [Leptothoe kymatousa]|uniref:Sterol desaturase family protein n=1 Tax=Leptothoe kymatousa TAU-MAC 1615 TaxID=2364775 RepID=A0ABS5Y189_9CYAN|nr:sterol desaturase family protein [Leptothoe kymatousa]MBT9311278.1 sterol desaturase family protein [Leptothoe kymatousa TAU-MAC 1615]